ncbi:GGDEF domain-containing protein [Paenibacillus sp. PK3_47]|uniref:GGDEF domain-containing protein n=1 Tax=Paenibacillus sp. PK3_47 TaxID=2072642 RepID=UPI00201E25C0|nr:GGDEF domain-containing protein [Paenibacillus sp. PK3_47]UQZ33100.1 GGDEF domain-containing protein [Paenibacillus sp. PK3_47]
MSKERIFDFSLFAAAVAIAFASGTGITFDHIYITALLLYWAFSSFYFHLRIVSRSGNSTIDYAISYSSSFGIFAGPLGTLAFECIYRFTVYFYKKKTKTADPGEFLDTFYNIGSATLAGSMCYYLYRFLYPYVEGIPFGYWLLFLFIVWITSMVTSTLLVLVFIISGDVKNWNEAKHLLFKSRTLLDFSKIALTNALLLRLVQAEQWEMTVALFLLNYIVSISFYSKSQSAQDKFERDKFEQMAYRDFLTGTYNRAHMDLMMKELGQGTEWIGIVVADIDRFKKINDNYNHAVGDKVIIHFADTLRAHLQEEDILFRSGGEEFTMFLRNKTFEQCYAAIGAILNNGDGYKASADFEDQEIQVHYSASFGLYYFRTDPRQKTSMEKGYVSADQLLLESKKLGRNRLSSKQEL